MIVRVTRDFQEEGNGGILFWPKLIRLFGRRTRRGFWCFDSSHSWHEKGTVVQLWMWAEKSDGLMAECHTRHVLHCCCVYRAIANGKKEERGLCLRQRLFPNRSQTLSLSCPAPPGSNFGRNEKHVILPFALLPSRPTNWERVLLVSCLCHVFLCQLISAKKLFLPAKAFYLFFVIFSPVECSTGCWSCLPFVSPPRFVCFSGGVNAFSEWQLLRFGLGEIHNFRLGIGLRSLRNLFLGSLVEYVTPSHAKNSERASFIPSSRWFLFNRADRGQQCRRRFKLGEIRGCSGGNDSGMASPTTANNKKIKKKTSID